MKNKRGISLIVLVITIIVMIILAAAVIITISNTGIINRANEAVDATNYKQVEQLAQLIWSEEFLAGKRDDSLKDAVLDKLEDYKDKYEFEVNNGGVTVTLPGAVKLVKNEYGFYFDKLYLTNSLTSVSGNPVLGYAFFEDETYVAYTITNTETGEMIITPGSYGSVDGYANLSANIPGVANLTFSEDGKTITNTVPYTMTMLEKDTVTGIKYGVEYIDAEQKLTMDNSSKVTSYYDGEVMSEDVFTVLCNKHVYTYGGGSGAKAIYAAPFGDEVILQGAGRYNYIRRASSAKVGAYLGATYVDDAGNELVLNADGTVKITGATIYNSTYEYIEGVGVYADDNGADSYIPLLSGRVIAYSKTGKMFRLK